MKRSFKLLFAAVAMLAVFCSGALAATEDGVKYLDGDGELQVQDSVTVISEATKSELNTDRLDQEWYVVKGHTKFTAQLIFTHSDAKIILEDGATLEVAVTTDDVDDSAIYPESFTIYAQSTDRARMGIISAYLTYTGEMDYYVPTAIFASDLSVHGGLIRARVRTTSPADDIGATAIETGTLTVGAGAFVEAAASTNGGETIGINANRGLVSSGDITATASSPTDAKGISARNVTIVGGVCRAVATGGDQAGIHISYGDLSVEGGWVDSLPKIVRLGSGVIKHTVGALIDGDTGTLKGETVIPVGMTATLREGVAMTVDPDAKIVNRGVLDLPASMSQEEIERLNITVPPEEETDDTDDDEGEDEDDSQMNTYDDRIIKSATTSEWDAGVGGGIAVVIGLPFADHNGEVWIDGMLLSEDEYDARPEGSDLFVGAIAAAAADDATKITIADDVIKQLVTENGEHALTVGFIDGTATHRFKVIGVIGLADDKDDTRPHRSSGGGGCATGAAAIVAIAAFAAMKRWMR